jgi:hypothetical protein
LLCVILAAGGVVGCGDDDDDDDTAAGDTDTDTDTDSDGDTDSDSDADGDESTSCADAVELTLNDVKGTAGKIDPPLDADYFVLKGATEGQYLVFYTIANENDDSTKVDTVLSLYSADGKTLLATADDQIPRANTDSELLYRVGADGDICVRIEEWSAWAESSEAPKVNMVYAVVVGEMDPDADANNPDTEPNDEDAQPLKFAEVTGGSYGTIYGVMDDADDVDMYGFTQPADAISTSLYVMPAGPGGSVTTGGAEQGHGSTLDVGEVQVTDVTSGDVLAALDFSLGAENMYVPLAEETEVTFSISYPDGASAGDNDFYVVKQYNNEEGNEPEMETQMGENDSMDDAQPLLPDAAGSSFILGHIQGDGDVDYYEFDADAGKIVVLACSSARVGSGVIGATFAVVDSEETVMQSEEEAEDADVYWTNDPYPGKSEDAVDIETTGTYYFVVSATGQDDVNTGTHYMCGIHVQDPA